MYDAGSGNQTQDTLVGGKRSHRCIIPTSHHLSDKEHKPASSKIKPV